LVCRNVRNSVCGFPFAGRRVTPQTASRFLRAASRTCRLGVAFLRAHPWAPPARVETAPLNSHSQTAKTSASPKRDHRDLFWVAIETTAISTSTRSPRCAFGGALFSLNRTLGPAKAGRVVCLAVHTAPCLECHRWPRFVKRILFDASPHPLAWRFVVNRTRYSIIRSCSCQELCQNQPDRICLKEFLYLFYIT